MSVTKRIPIAIGIKPNQQVEFTNKTIDGTRNTLQNIPTNALQFDTISINGIPVSLGQNLNLGGFTTEYSSIPSNPTVLSAANNEYHFEGDVQAGDVDYVTFTVGPTPITALFLTYYESLDSVAFFAIQPGTSWTAGQDTSQMLVYSHFGPGQVGTNVLNGVVLQPNTPYTLWVQQTGNYSTKYVFSNDPSYTGSRSLVDTNTTYSIKASPVTSGASLDLDASGSGVGTDSVNFVGAGNVTVTRVDANTIQIGDAGSLGGVALTANNTATLTNKTISGSSNTITNISNSSLTNPFITINGTQVALGGAITVEGGGGGGTGDVTLTGAQTLTNKTISGLSNNLTNIQNNSLSNPYISINGTQVALGSNFNVSGLGDVTTTGTQDLSNKSLLAPIIQNAKLIGTLTVGSGNGTTGTNGQVLKSTGTGLEWTNQSSLVAGSVATALTIGSGLLGTGGTEFNGSNGVTVSINTAIVATLTGAQMLSSKTLSNTTLTGSLTIGGSTGTAGQTIVADGAGGIAWGAGSGGGSGSFNGPSSATDNAIVRFDGATGALAQNSLVTISDTGAITAPSTGSIIPFYYANQLSFPAATTYNGALAVSDADDAAFFSNGSTWIQLANSADVTVSSRNTFSTGNFSLNSNASSNRDLTGAYKSYLLFKIQTSHAAWVRVYTSSAARSADSSRGIDVDPVPGSGVIAEVITTGASTQVLTPAVIGFNDDSVVTNTIYLTVTNRSGANQAAFNVTLTALKLEA